MGVFPRPLYVSCPQIPVKNQETRRASPVFEFLQQMAVLGQAPEVQDELIEVYASISAMGPSYFWFLFYELVNLGESFGLTREQALEAVSNMLIGAAKTMAESGLSPDEVMDLIPTRPLAEEEEKIKETFRQKIQGIYNKLKS